MSSSPPMTGRTPLSPALIRATQARRYSPSESATSSGATARFAWLAAASVSSASAATLSG